MRLGTKSIVGQDLDLGERERHERNPDRRELPRAPGPPGAAAENLANPPYRLLTHNLHGAGLPSLQHKTSRAAGGCSYFDNSLLKFCAERRGGQVAQGSSRTGHGPIPGAATP